MHKRRKLGLKWLMFTHSDWAPTQVWPTLLCPSEWDMNVVLHFCPTFKLAKHCHDKIFFIHILYLLHNCIIVGLFHCRNLMCRLTVYSSSQILLLFPLSIVRLLWGCTSAIKFRHCSGSGTKFQVLSAEWNVTACSQRQQSKNKTGYAFG